MGKKWCKGPKYGKDDNPGIDLKGFASGIEVEYFCKLPYLKN